MKATDFTIVLVGIVLAVAWWVIEATLHYVVFSAEGTFLQQLVFPCFHELWMRTLTLAVIVLFGISAQILFNRQRRAEKEIRKTHAELDQVFQTAADGMRVVDRDFNMLRMNDTFLELAGLRRDEAAGRKCYEVFSSSLCHTPACPLTRILASEACVVDEIEKERRDGSKVPCIVTATTFRNPDGEVIGIVEDFKDISERKRAERKLAGIQKQIEFILGATKTGLDIIDPDFNLRYVDPGWQKTYGDPEGRKCYEYFMGRTEPCPGCGIPKALAGKAPFVSEEILVREGNRPIQVTTIPFQDEHGEWLVAEVNVDITELKHAQDELKKHRDHLQELVEERTAELTERNTRLRQEVAERKRAEDALATASRKLNLLSGITRHDILNQLTALRGYLGLMRDAVDDPVSVTDFLEEETRIAETIEYQIMFTRDYQEMGMNAPEWQDVNAVVGKAIQGLPLRDIRVTVDCTDVEVFADPLVERVFHNLIDNALRYGGDRMTWISISSHETDAGLVITCEDDGAGIGAEDRKHLFNRGFGKHTGLGLFLSREILSITGITITETGEPGKGARFEITVPEGGYRVGGPRPGNDWRDLP